MKIIIDAYNLLHAMHPGPRASEQQREGLIADLMRYAQKSGNKIILVFDGGDMPYSYQEKRKHITLIWAGYHMSADDWIMEHLQKNQGEDMLVASSDREIQAYAAQLGIVGMGAYSFYKTMVKSLREKVVPPRHHAPLQKTAQHKNRDIDALMDAASEDMEWKDEEYEKKDRKSTAKKDSKSERRLLRQLKKL
ncbi:MAG: NYN domain-containing protein [Candidatus Babeliales bacterium]